MQLMNHFKTLEKLSQLFFKNNYELYMVGGAVRDILMDKIPHDYDFATNATPDQMLKIAEESNIEVIPTGIKYGTVTFRIDNQSFEVTTYRADGNYSDGRRPDQVTFSTNILDDLSRRDFTVNAIALNMLSNVNNYVDPFNGIKDIESKVIRTVGDPVERFTEDGLRILRAIRFKFKLKFKLDNDTYNTIQNNWNLLTYISQERITSEFLQILDYCTINSQQDALLIDGLIYYLLPEVWYKNDYDNNFWRYEAIKGFSDTECKLAYLLREAKSSPEIICKRLKLSNEFTKDVCDTLKAFDYIITLDTDLDAVAERDVVIARKIVSKYGTKNALRAWEIFADEYGVTPYDYNNMYELLEMTANRWSVTLKDLAINGDDLIQLGFKGREIGKVLDYCLDQVLRNQNLNEKEKLIGLVKHYNMKEVIEEYTEVDGDMKLLKRKVTVKNVPPDITIIKMITDNTKEVKKLSDDELEEEKQKLLKLLKDKEE